MTALVPLRPERFRTFAEEAIASFASDGVQASRWREEESVDLARTLFARLLPEGPSTPGHHFHEIRESIDGAVVGYVWFAVNDDGGHRSAYLYNIRIDPAFRGRGHATAALALVDGMAREMGATRIALHVYAFNTTAQALYRSVGYWLTGVNMVKMLPPRDA